MPKGCGSSRIFQMVYLFEEHVQTCDVRPERRGLATGEGEGVSAARRGADFLRV